MAEIILTKHQTLEDGSVSGMFRIPADKVNKAIRHELVDLEGEPVNVERVTGSVDEKPAQELTAEDCFNAASEYLEMGKAKLRTRAADDEAELFKETEA